MTWCCLLFVCFTRANSFDAFAYVRQVLPSWSVCFRFALYWNKLFKFYRFSWRKLKLTQINSWVILRFPIAHEKWSGVRRSRGETVQLTCSLFVWASRRIIVFMSLLKKIILWFKNQNVNNSQQTRQLKINYSLHFTCLPTNNDELTTYFTTDSISCCPIEMLKLSAGKNSLASYFLRIQFSFSSLEDVGTKTIHNLLTAQ